MSGVVIGLIVALSALRVPIGFALIAAVLVALLAGGGTTPAVIPLHLFSGAAKFPLLAIPLFILAGGIMSSAGISLRIINMASTLVGHIRGGQIGRAACRERVEISVVGVSLKKKKRTNR